ncbi:MAG: AMP-binding protein [Acidobacteria bacterium]|nr:AMP-binding protein [Acidobacteriota bacterium]
MHLWDLFDLSLVGAEEAVGLEFESADHHVSAWTFGELRRRALRMAQALKARGVRPGDRVAAYLPNGIEFIDVFLGTLRCGAVFTPINVLYRERELSHIVADADPALTVAGPGALDMFSGMTDVVPVDRLAAEAEAAAVESAPIALDGDAPAIIIYTSGTTGRSKGAVLSHNNVLTNAANIVTAWRVTSADRYLAVLPLFHVHGLANGVCSWLASGCRMRLVERFDRHHAAGLFEAFRPTLFFGVPTVFIRLLALDAEVARRIGQHMRLFVSGSAPLPPQVFADFRERFGHAILERYGMSETLMLVSNPYAGERRPGTVGSALPGVSIRIVGEDGRDVAVGQPGQILVRGSNVFQGYWRNDAATSAAFDGSWFRTGDIGEKSADGYITLRGRATELIISGGFNVYPREIEDVLLEAPGIRDAAVLGRPDPVRGEVPVAYVVTDDLFEEEAARAHCSRVLASFKVPRTFVRVDGLPRNALGKIQKHLLPSDGREAEKHVASRPGDTV